MMDCWLHCINSLFVNVVQLPQVFDSSFTFRYIPILPMVLVNGADGIGTGWATKIPNYNPREIVDNLMRMLDGQDPKEMLPWFKNFRGSFAQLGHQKYVCNGEVATLGANRVEITELPVRTWTTSYREDVEKMMTGDEKTGPAQIQDFKDYNTDKTVRMVVQMEEEKLRKAEEGKGLHVFFKLQTTLSTTSMVLFDHMGCLRTYESVKDILVEFFNLRLEYYGKRKAYMEGMMGAEAAKLSNQARFILEKCKGDLKIENKKKQAMIEELVKRKYDSDPVKAWKNSQDVDDDQEEEPEGDEGSQEVIVSKKSKGPDFDYLMGMPMWNLTQEKIDELCKKRDEKRQELNELKATSKEELWRRDLREFLAKLDEVEEGERMDDEEGGGGGGETKPVGKATKGKSKGKGGAVVKADTLPSKHAVRVEPKVSDDLKAKVVQAAALKVRKQTKKEEGKVKDVERDEFDEMADDEQNVRQRINSGDNAKVKKQRNESGGAKTKQTKLNFKPVDKKPKRNPWSDVDSDEDIAGIRSFISPCVSL